jgi:hypothetical protein
LLEKRIDEGCDRRSLGKDEYRAKKQQDNDDRQEPKLFSRSQEGPHFGNE